MDHPRSRGVYTTSASPSCDWEGSSPLARGLPHQRPQRVHRPRIIPARAGFTARSRATAVMIRDHPRSRGVYRALDEALEDAGGSSPLARGLLFGRAGRYGEGRIIPARAGFTAMSTRPLRPGRDHPRSRGVYASRSAGLSAHQGSSPLARGLRQPVRRAQRPPGIIPARAGFTTAPWAGRRGRTDHPRSRGVYVEGAGAEGAPSGSSPLARGLRPDA